MYQIVITEMPYQVRKADLVERLAELIDAKKAPLLGDVRDESAEDVRLVLEPTQASRLGGEFRSGKRLNMRRIIPYIASNFRKDKIWQRRSRPDGCTMRWRR
jgi:midasin (ATPase involved in ribosome maturation)